MAIPRKIRRALAHDRELKGLPPARPWQHAQKCAERRDDMELLKQLALFCSTRKTDFNYIRELLVKLDTGHSEKS